MIAGVRDSDSGKLSEYRLAQRKFDFEEVQTFKEALLGIDVLFLLSPPQLANVDRYFKPLINEAVSADIKHIVFLSVQGVENSKMIPHHKIERLIIESGIPYTFLRPAYFMQNFVTTLHSDLVTKHGIFLPAGNARFTLIDVEDIGLVASKILAEPLLHQNTSYELTSNEALTFAEMASQLSAKLGHTIMYTSPNLLRFYLAKRSEGYPPMFILVVIMLHFLPRFQKTPSTTHWVKSITGKEPSSFVDFIQSNIDRLR